MVNCLCVWRGGGGEELINAPVYGEGAIDSEREREVVHVRKLPLVCVHGGGREGGREERVSFSLPQYYFLGLRAEHGLGKTIQ